ncbi:MAG: DNA polymerase III subunit delta [Clostridia bacterium]|nr:DNA polymerase III subunit delta [Clostridia bacterium]
MTANEFRQELKKLKGGYLFCGEEDYLKRRYRQSVREALVPEDDIFNHIRLNAETYSPDRLMAAIEALPVMAERKLIEVEGIPLSSLPEGELEELVAVLATLPSYEYNVLILYAEAEELDAGTVKTPSKVLKHLSEALTPVIFWRETPARLAAWVAKHFAAEKIVAPPDTVNRLLERCGCDMFTLSSEIEKLAWYVKAQGRERLTEEDVALVSSETKEIAAFDLANAIMDGRVDTAVSILNEQKRRKEKPELLLAGITRVICDLLAVKVMVDGGVSYGAIGSRFKMHEYKVGLYAKSAARLPYDRLHERIEQCYGADLLIKGGSLDPYAVLDRLVIGAALR